MLPRRTFLTGCAAAFSLALAAEAQARPLRAPRVRCVHGGCRHYRADSAGGPGWCGFAVAGAEVAYPDEPLPAVFAGAGP